MKRYKLNDKIPVAVKGVIIKGDELMKKGKMYFNVIHRMGGWKENIDMLARQQEMAHANGLKTTIVMSYESLFIEEAVNMAKEHSKQYGDEIALLLNTIDDIYGMLNGNYTFWLFSTEEKRHIIDVSISKFKEVFGFCPTALTTYYLDAPTINYIHEKYPEVEAVIATCFEEGSRVFRGTNYSCQLFCEGGPWWPWIPSKKNSQCPAFDEQDDAGVVALPHLTRDMLLAIEDRNDYFASHPQNITRGWAYKGTTWEYLYNFLDMQAIQFEYNDGYSYCNMYADPKWLLPNGGHDDDVVVPIYEDAMKYLGELKKKEYLVDMGLTEFARWFRKNRGYKPSVSLWQDVLEGSEKQVFWYIDPYMRALIDPVQGGAITDFRPYVSRLDRPVGPDTECLEDGSYPFIINTQVRSGYPAFMQTRSMYTCAVSYGKSTQHLKNYWSKCTFEKTEEGYTAVLEPAEIELWDVKATLQTKVVFAGNGEIHFKRKLIECSKPDAEIELLEFMNGCWGTTEYPTDLRQVTLSCVTQNETKSLKCKYSNTSIETDNIKYVCADIPNIDTKVKISSDLSDASGLVFDGTMGGPMFTIGIKGKIKLGEEKTTCLKIEKL